MDEQSKIRLNEIREKTPKELTKDQIGFLRARRTYLTLTDKDKFKDILKKK